MSTVAASTSTTPIESGPPCELCGYTIEDLEELIYLRAADLIAEWERTDPRDSWRHTGEHRPRSVAPPRAAPPPYSPAQSTVDAFRLVAAGGDVERLKAWLADRPKDAPLLLALLESPASC